jgi:hypothetical protein
MITRTGVPNADGEDARGMAAEFPILSPTKVIAAIITAQTF